MPDQTSPSIKKRSSGQKCPRREFRQSTTREQRVDLLRCIYAVAAADGTISGVETNEIRQIAEELGFTRPEANALRSEYRDQLAELQTPAAREREPR